MKRISKLFRSLQYLGINPTMDTFTERKKLQKLVYLLDKVFGMDFNFTYNWYLHGPYSPEVTKLLFDGIEDPQVDQSDFGGLSVDDWKKLEQLKLFLKDDLNSTDQLELLVSLHYLMQYLKHPNITEKDVVTFLKKKKPYFTDEEIASAMDQIRTLRPL